MIVNTLFSFPHAGGFSHNYIPLQKALAREVNVICLDYPGHGSRIGVPLTNCFDTLACDCVDQVLAACATMEPCEISFFGHSLGAYVALAAAQTLERQHAKKIMHLFCSSARSPKNITDHGFPYDTRSMSDLEFVLFLVERLGADDRILTNLEFSSFFIEILRADFEIFYNARREAAEPISSAVTTMLGDKDDIQPSQMREWEHVGKGAFDFKLFRGSHFYLFEQIDAVAQFIKSSLNSSSR